MPDTVKLVTLGCDKNRVDSEILLGLLREAGYAAAQNEAEADVLIVNTCGFIREAVQEGIETILSAAAYKQSGRCKALLVVGCMAQRYRDEVMREIPEVDAVFGVNEYHAIVSAVLGLTTGAAPVSACPAKEAEADDEYLYAGRLADGLSHLAYVKIAEGCDNRCAYCTIPSIRGAYRSRPFEGIVEECRSLIRQGARELVLVAQDTARYGTDRYGKPRLHELLQEIASLEGVIWVRLMYAYPEHITHELIDVMASHNKICRYLDMPIQHSHDAVLSRMGRKSTQEGLKTVIEELRAKVPGIILRTTLMVGFPGETEEEFEALHEFVKDTRFDRLGVFAYSREDGTKAARMKPQVKAHIKKKRRAALMTLQQTIHRQKQYELRGQTLTVMIDALTNTDQDGLYHYSGRSYRDAYEVDAAVFFTSRAALAPGDMAEVTITGSDEYDLYGAYSGEAGAAQR